MPAANCPTFPSSFYNRWCFTGSLPVATPFLTASRISVPVFTGAVDLVAVSWGRRQSISSLLVVRKGKNRQDHPRYATALGPKAVYLHDKGYFNQAEQLYQQIAKIFKDSYGETHYEYARAINNLAYLYEDQGKLQQAYQLYHQSVELRTQLDPDNHIRIATPPEEKYLLLPPREMASCEDSHEFPEV